MLFGYSYLLQFTTGEGTNLFFNLPHEKYLSLVYLIFYPLALPLLSEQSLPTASNLQVRSLVSDHDQNSFAFAYRPTALLLY